MTQTQKTHFADDDTLAHISDIEEENNRLLMANRDCVDHFNELLRDYNELKEQLAEAQRDAVPITDIESEIAHIKENGAAVREKCGDEYEGRCRELCAMYLNEFITSWRMQQKIDAIDQAIQEQKK